MSVFEVPDILDIIISYVASGFGVRWNLCSYLLPSLVNKQFLYYNRKYVRPKIVFLDALKNALINGNHVTVEFVMKDYEEAVTEDPIRNNIFDNETGTLSYPIRYALEWIMFNGNDRKEDYARCIKVLLDRVKVSIHNDAGHLARLTSLLFMVFGINQTDAKTIQKKCLVAACEHYFSENIESRTETWNAQDRKTTMKWAEFLVALNNSVDTSGVPEISLMISKFFVGSGIRIEIRALWMLYGDSFYGEKNRIYLGRPPTPNRPREPDVVASYISKGAVSRTVALIPDIFDYYESKQLFHFLIKPVLEVDIDIGEGAYDDNEFAAKYGKYKVTDRIIKYHKNIQPDLLHETLLYILHKTPFGVRRSTLLVKRILDHPVLLTEHVSTKSILASMFTGVFYLGNPLSTVIARHTKFQPSDFGDFATKLCIYHDRVELMAKALANPDSNFSPSESEIVGLVGSDRITDPIDILLLYVCQLHAPRCLRYLLDTFKKTGLDMDLACYMVSNAIREKSRFDALANGNIQVQNRISRLYSILSNDERLRKVPITNRRRVKREEYKRNHPINCTCRRCNTLQYTFNDLYVRVNQLR